MLSPQALLRNGSATITSVVVWRLPAVLGYGLYPTAALQGVVPEEFPEHWGCSVELAGGATGGAPRWYTIERSVGILVGGPFAADPTPDVAEEVVWRSPPLRVALGQWWASCVHGRNEAVYLVRFCPWACNCQHFCQDVVRACGFPGAIDAKLQDPRAVLGKSPVWRSAGGAAKGGGLGGLLGGFTGGLGGGLAGAAIATPVALGTLGLALPLVPLAAAVGTSVGTAVGSVGGASAGGVLGAISGLWRWRRESAR